MTGLTSLLNGQPDFKVVGEASSVREAIPMTRDLQPDLILMDFVLPDGTGLDATRAILADEPGTNIVFLTVYEEDDRLFAAIRGGAKGYLLKNVPIAKLLSFLRGIEHGEAAILPAMAGRILDEFSRLIMPLIFCKSGLTPEGKARIYRKIDAQSFFEEIIRENPDLGRPERVQLIFERQVTQATPSPFRTGLIQQGIQPSLHID